MASPEDPSRSNAMAAFNNPTPILFNIHLLFLRSPCDHRNEFMVLRTRESFPSQHPRQLFLSLEHSFDPSPPFQWDRKRAFPMAHLDAFEFPGLIGSVARFAGHSAYSPREQISSFSAVKLSPCRDLNTIVWPRWEALEMDPLILPAVFFSSASYTVKGSPLVEHP